MKIIAIPLLSFQQLLICAWICNSPAQTIQHAKTLHTRRAPFETTLYMGGNLDAENTSYYSADGRLIRGFEPMVSIRISNQGLTTLKSPRFLINNKSDWFTLDEMVATIFHGAPSNREKALKLWKFITENRMHAASPASGCDISDPLHLLGIFGYATCAPTASAVTGIASYLGYPSRIWHLSADYQNHTIAEVDFGDGFVVIDPDAQAFYLDYDNATPVSMKAIQDDHYLISRTHHFGPAKRSDYKMQTLYSGINAESGPSSCKNASLDFNLRPGESIIYQWSKARDYFHHILPASFTPPFPIANNLIVFDVPLKIAKFDDIFDSFSNIKKNVWQKDKTVIGPDSVGEKSEFVIKIYSPFIILDSQIVFTSHHSTPLDQIALDFSADGSNWKRIWRSTVSGVIQNGLSLSSYIADLSAAQRHDFYLKFRLMPRDSATACGIHAIKISSTFQASRFFMPSIGLGKNLITYTDQNSAVRDVEIEIKWKESNNNTPPLAIEKPLYPLPNSETANLQFVFRWPAATDPNGDLIADYHFQLSDRPDMSSPLSPNFDIYLSTLEKTFSPQFTIPWPGLLNSGNYYYWHVRARDARGAWSDWSETWAFKALGVMPPVDLHISRDMKGNDILTWTANQSGIAPAFYQIYASNEPNGFLPFSNTIVGVSKQTTFPLSSRELAYYRVVSVDSAGNISGPSRVTSAK